MATERVAQLEICPRDRSAGNCPRLASEGVSDVLELEVPARQTGQASSSAEIRRLIRMLSRNNPMWEAPRVHGELQKLGLEITEPTVAQKAAVTDVEKLS